jgi:hypothetical protein
MIKNTQELWIAVSKGEKLEDLKKHTLVKISKEEFDSLYLAIVGIVRASDQYSFKAMDFSGSANALDNQELHVIKEGKTIKELKEKLLNLKKFIPNSANSVILDDLNQINQIKIDDVKSFETEKKRTWDWSDLVFGTRSVSDILTPSGKLFLNVFYALIAVLILLVAFSLGGYGIYYFVNWLFSVFKVSVASLTTSNIKDTISTITSISTFLTGLGLSLGVVAQRAWKGLKSLHDLIALWIAKSAVFRNACQDQQ